MAGNKFSDAVMLATYKDGKVGVDSEAHEQSKNHRFKTELLFKDTIISPKIYALRLTQFYLIFKALETALQNLPQDRKNEMSGFFTLNYLAELWRTPLIEEDLKALVVDLKNSPETAESTKEYLDYIPHLSNKQLLAHWFTHIAGYFHGGKIVLDKIEESNKLTSDSYIPSSQYRFHKAMEKSDTKSPMALYGNLKSKIDTMPLDSEEFEELKKTCLSVYERVVLIYNDLCDISMNVSFDLKINASKTSLLAGVMLIMLALAYFLKGYADTEECVNAPSM